MIAMTPNRSAGRIGDPMWAAFLAKARRRGLTNTDAMREALQDWIDKNDTDAEPERVTRLTSVAAGVA
jgi:CRISPR/Cas system CSM-associated protein Csm2 small subunit